MRSGIRMGREIKFAGAGRFLPLAGGAPYVRMAALAITLAEWMKFGPELAAQTIAFLPLSPRSMVGSLPC